MIINLDVDGVIRDLMTASIQVYKEQYDARFDLKHSQFINYDFNIMFPLMGDVPQFFKDNKNQLFLNARAYDGATYFVNSLKNSGHTIQIVTSQFKGTEGSTLQWLYDNKINYDSLHFTKNKNSVKGDILIDDCLDNLVQSDKPVICVDRPWNQDWVGTRAYNYDEIVKYIEGKDE